MVVTISKAGLGTGGAFLSNVTWETLEKLDADLAGTGTRLTYLDACLEILAFLSEDRTEKKFRPAFRDLYADEKPRFLCTR